MIDTSPFLSAPERIDSAVFAEDAGFQALANAYLREVRPGGLARVAISLWTALVPLDGGERLLLEIDYKSLVGRHRIRRVLLIRNSGDAPAPVSVFRAALLLIGSLYPENGKTHGHSRNEAELVARYIESIQNMATNLEARRDDAGLRENTFLASEQSLLLGHWMHPTPKSRQGVAWWQQSEYSPELKGGFRLHFFAVDSTLVVHRSAEQSSAVDIANAVSGGTFAAALGAGETLVPVHPLQGAWLLAQPHVRAEIATGRIRPLGPAGAVFYPTSSVRTVYRDDSPWMFKFSIPVKITNSLRINRAHELDVGVVMTRLLRGLDFFNVYPYFHVIDDPASLTVRLPGLRESGFEVIIRTNPFRNSAADGVVCLAALTQDAVPVGGRYNRLDTIVHDLSELEGRPCATVARDWFEQYWQCAVEPLILLFDRHGIALEAHQQNSLLNVRNGYPTHYHFRDNQGFYLSRSRRDDLLALCPEVSEIGDLFYDDAMIFKRFGYYLLFNQLFSVIHRLGADGHLAESDALAMCREWLKQLRKKMRAGGAAFADHLLASPTLSCKANLLTRARDLDELETEGELVEYVELPNPFRLPTGISENKREGF